MCVCVSLSVQRLKGCDGLLDTVTGYTCWLRQSVSYQLLAADMGVCPLFVGKLLCVGRLLSLHL